MRPLESAVATAPSFGWAVIAVNVRRCTCLHHHVGSAITLHWVSHRMRLDRRRFHTSRVFLDVAHSMLPLPLKHTPVIPLYLKSWVFFFLRISNCRTCLGSDPASLPALPVVRIICCFKLGCCAMSKTAWPIGNTWYVLSEPRASHLWNSPRGSHRQQNPTLELCHQGILYTLAVRLNHKLVLASLALCGLPRTVRFSRS